MILTLLWRRQNWYYHYSTRRTATQVTSTELCLLPDTMMTVRIFFNTFSTLPHDCLKDSTYNITDSSRTNVPCPNVQLTCYSPIWLFGVDWGEKKNDQLIILLCFTLVRKIMLLTFPLENKFGFFKMSKLLKNCLSLGLESSNVIITTTTVDSVDLVPTVW